MHPNDTVLNEYVDEALDPRERREVDAHVTACAACRQLVEDFREIRAAAAALEPREAPVRAWTRLERAIRLEQRPTQGPSSVLRKTPFWLAAAAAVVLATAVGLRYTGTSGTPRGATAPAAAPSAATAREAAQAPGRGAAAAASDPATSVETELRQAEEHYEKAIQGLERIAKTEQSALDPRTAATLQKNLAVIDQAIGESRAALRAQPASEPAQESLMENFKSKIALLQDTVALINEMRKGNDAGAARIVSGLKQKGD